MTIHLLALAMGIVSGLRAMTPPAAVSWAAQNWIVGAVLGAVGAVIGTLGGAKARGALAEKFGKDLPAALIEDAVALGGAALIVLSLR